MECKHPNCTIIPREGDRCFKHRLCKEQGCKAFATDAKSGLCKRHGGGKRCKYPECDKGAEGPDFCVEHGGGKRCTSNAHVSDNIPPAVYWRDPYKKYCLPCFCNYCPKNLQFNVTKEQLIIAEIQRLCPWMENNFLKQNCKIGNTCTDFRPDCMWDFLLMWLSVEIDEHGHDQAVGKYDKIYKGMGERPGLLIRINPDLIGNRLFSRKVMHTGILKDQYVWSGSANFLPFMQNVANLIHKEIYEVLKSNSSFGWTGVREIKLNFQPLNPTGVVRPCPGSKGRITDKITIG